MSISHIHFYAFIIGLCIGSFIVNKSEIKDSELIKNDDWLKKFPLD